MTRPESPWDTLLKGTLQIVAVWVLIWAIVGLVCLFQPAQAADQITVHVGDRKLESACLLHFDHGADRGFTVATCNSTESFEDGPYGPHSAMEFDHVVMIGKETFTHCRLAGASQAPKTRLWLQYHCMPDPKPSQESYARLLELINWLDSGATWEARP